jgi:hypothetical protein
MSYISGYSFPFRFTANCDVMISEDDFVLNDNIKTTLMLSRYGIPLFPMGTDIINHVFDMNDNVFESYIGFKIQEQINSNVQGVRADKNSRVIRNENTVSVAIPYYNTIANKSNMSLLNITDTGDK